MARVDVYRNLHKGMYSIRQDGVVVAHAPSVVLANPTFKVSTAGRERVRKEKRKNVHAIVRGELVGIGETPCFADPILVTYNPYKNETFVTTDGEPIHSAGMAYLGDDYKIRIW